MTANTNKHSELQMPAISNTEKHSPRALYAVTIDDTTVKLRFSGQESLNARLASVLSAVKSQGNTA